MRTPTQRMRSAPYAPRMTPVVNGEQCTAPTRAGKTCRSAAMKGTGLCYAHTPGGLLTRCAEGGIAKRKPRPNEVLRGQLEELNDDAIRALTEALRADRALVVGQGPTAWVATAPDHAVRLGAAKELWDRLYGRPAQTTRLEAGGGGVLLAAVLPPDDPGHTAEVQELLERATGNEHATIDVDGEALEDADA